MWNSGYVSEVDYTFGHFSFLSPNNLKFAALMEGGKHSVPDNPTYLELGCGQGISLNMHAASNPGQYWGADFSPTQTSTALEYAKHGAGNLKLFDDSFQDLLRRPDLPQFDMIVLHGIWSWVPPTARAAIVEIARDHLKPGGLFHIALKEGTGEHRDTLGRLYTYVTETELSDLLRGAGLHPVETRTGADTGLDGSVAEWVTILARKPADD